MRGVLSVGRVISRVLLLGAVSAFAAAPVLVVADEPDGPGVAIDASRIDVDDVLASGDRYELPPITVRNPGAVRAAYVMTGSEVEGKADPANPDWLVFSPREFALAPGSTQVVKVSLVVPEDAAPGEYEGLLLASLKPEGEGATVGAGAGTVLTFTIQDSDDLEVPPWVWWASAASVLLLLAVWLVVRIAGRYEVVVRRREG